MLQLQAQLLVGIVRIYQKKMNYLSDDCQDAMKSSFSYEKKKKLLLQPEKSKGSSKKAKHLQDASQIDALYELPDLSLAELQQKLEEEALIQRADAHQARDSELQMDEYLLDQPNEAAGLDDLEDDGFDYTFDLGLDVNKILKSVVEDGFSGDLASLLESAPSPMDDDQDGDDDSGGMQQIQPMQEPEESLEFQPPLEINDQEENPEYMDIQMQEPEEPPQFDNDPQFDNEPQFQEPEAPPPVAAPIEKDDSYIQPEPQPQYEEPQPEEQLISPVQSGLAPEYSNQEQSFDEHNYQHEMQYQMPEQSFDQHENPERSTLDLVHKSYEANDEVQYKDAGELELNKDDEDWYEPEEARLYRYESENLDAQEDISDFSEDEYVDTPQYTPRKNKKTSKKRKKNFTPKKRNRKRKKNFRDEITELTSEWIRDSISNTTAIIYKKRPSVELTRYPRHLHNRSKEGMDSLIEMPFVRGLAPQLLKMFQQKVWTRCHTFNNRDYMEDDGLAENHLYEDEGYPLKFDNEGDYEMPPDYNDYNEEYGDYQLAGDPDLGGMEESGYLSDADRDEPPRKRMKTHHEEEIMPHQSHDSLPPEVPQQEHEPIQQEHEDLRQDEEPIVNEEPPEEPFESSIPQDGEAQVGAAEVTPQQRDITLDQDQPVLQDGFTYKTLQTMQFLGSQEERTLSFKSLTEGQSCKVAAGLFYELLVIRSKGMVQLDQPEPYGDTKISKCDQFDEFLQM